MARVCVFTCGGDHMAVAAVREKLFNAVVVQRKTLFQFQTIIDLPLTSHLAIVEDQPIVT